MPRPKAFDPAEKLDDAMNLFWRHGFETTSIPKLEENLNINRFSIYDTYGDKRSLFMQVLALYTNKLVKLLVEPLENGTRGLSDLRRFFNEYERQFAKAGQIRGCLLCNTATELGGRDTEIADAIESYFDRVENAVCASLQRARKLSEIQSGDADIRNHARLLRCSLQGILVELRLTGDPEKVRPALRAVRKFIRSLQRVEH